MAVDSSSGFGLPLPTTYIFLHDHDYCDNERHDKVGIDSWSNWPCTKIYSGACWRASAGAGREGGAPHAARRRRQAVRARRCPAPPAPPTAPRRSRIPPHTAGYLDVHRHFHEPFLHLHVWVVTMQSARVTILKWLWWAFSPSLSLRNHVAELGNS